MTNELTEKRVLVTGGSSGIGAGIARAFGAQGAQVLIQYRRSAEGAEQTAAAIRNAGGRAATIQADLRAESAIDRLFATVDQSWGRLDVLVNNAGVVHKGSALETTAAYWDDTMNINLRAPYLMSRQAARRMIDGDGGHIVNITSVAGFRSGENFSAYAASKAALDALTRILALEWAPHGIRVNAVAPGVVPVERQEAALRRVEETWMQYIPLGRYGEPADVAAMVLFLCSRDAGWITGQTFTVDGGATARSNTPPRGEVTLPPPPDPIVEG